MEKNNQQIITEFKTVFSSNEEFNKKLELFYSVLMKLDPINNGIPMIFGYREASNLCIQFHRPDMAAQFLLMKAKLEVGQVGPLIHEMKNITLAPNWFNFATEEEQESFKTLKRLTKEHRGNAQADIENAMALLKQNPVDGAVGSCYKLIGEIYGQMNLQLRLEYMIPTGSWRSRVSNYKIARYFRIDDFLLLEKNHRVFAKNKRLECIRYINLAVNIFKKANYFEHLADAYLSLALEHYSFGSPLRSKWYLLKARRLIDKHGIENLRIRLNSISKNH